MYDYQSVMNTIKISHFTILLFYYFTFLLFYLNSLFYVAVLKLYKELTDYN